MKEKIAASERNHDDVLQYKLHVRKAVKFYDLLKESRRRCDTLAVTFDMQQNMPLPKTNVTEAYYKRQIWLYNLAFVIHDYDQNPRKVRFYTWTENQSGKGSNEVGSALAHFLKKLTRLASKRNYRQLHFFCDSCPAQNKNQTLLSILLRYSNSPNMPFQEVKVFFPIRGHSYMPPDRVFGRVSKVLRKRPVIVSPEEYYSVFTKFAQHFPLGPKWAVYDYAAMSKRMLKRTALNLQLSRVWTFVRNQRTVKISSTYFGDGVTHKPLKDEWAGHRLVACKATLLPQASHVSVEKAKDVQELLSLVPLTEEARQFYNQALKSPMIKKKKSASEKFQYAVAI